jgi:hypothetical protein
MDICNQYIDDKIAYIDDIGTEMGGQSRIGFGLINNRRF